MHSKLFLKEIQLLPGSNPSSVLLTGGEFLRLELYQVRLMMRLFTLY